MPLHVLCWSYLQASIRNLVPIEAIAVGKHVESFFVKPVPEHPHYYKLVLSPSADGTDQLATKIFFWAGVD